MYCGTNKTAVASQWQITSALLALLSEMPYGEISVSAICKRADVSRQTFYSLFQAKDNVITFALRNDCCYSQSTQPDCCEHSFRQMCAGFGQYIVRHADILRVLAAHDLMPLLRCVLREDFSRCLSGTRCTHPALEPYVIDFIAAGITSIAETYVRSGQDADPAALEEIIYLLMRGEYYR
ncbi:MAG: TetR/AcrR family transcriptional regulator [Clostridia bacterium]|nr:TetR/AcrR family transcriptional regulator [Clostridia bacterium]